MNKLLDLICVATMRLAQRWVSLFVSNEFRIAAPSELSNGLPTGGGQSLTSGRELEVGGSSEAERIERYDRLYKSVGMTHRVQANIERQVGRSERVDFWMRYPSEGAISEAFRKRGVLNALGFQVIEL